LSVDWIERLLLFLVMNSSCCDFLAMRPLHKDMPRVTTATMRQKSRPAALAFQWALAGHWLPVAAIGMALLMPGCSLAPFGHKTIDESLRRQAQADPFPNAQQTGLAGHISE
jgi:hypothetical protein